MEVLFEESGLLGIFLLLASLGVIGLFAKNILELFNLGKMADTANKDREKYIEVKAKNQVLKEKILENQAQREVEIQEAVNLIPNEKNSEIEIPEDTLVNEWNKKFGKEK